MYDFKNLRKYIYVSFGLFIIQTGFFDVEGNVVLSPSTAIAAEGDLFTFRCIYSGSETVSGFVWLLNGNTLAVIFTSICTPFVNPGPPDSSLYEYACPSEKQITFTIKNISNMNNGDNWQCAASTPGYIHSNVVTIVVQVFVRNISLTPQNGAMKENIETTFKCGTSASRPAANITWHKKSTNGNLEMITDKVSSVTQDEGDLEKSISELKYTPFRYDNGHKIYCEASNIPGKKVVSSKYTMNIQYPPKLRVLTEKNIVEGSQLNISCPYEKGNPEETTFKWTRNGDSRQWNDDVLHIENITKHDDMIYTCTVHNVMKPTGASEEIGIDSISFHVNVFYKPTITSFAQQGDLQASTVTLNENENITFVCIIDSNPSSSVEIAFEDKVIYRQKNTKSVRFNHKALTCLDAGTYTCSAQNEYNSGKHTSANFELRVKCSPRPLRQVKTNFTSLLNETVTLTFSTLAYPEPGITGFHWYKHNSITWIPLLSNTDLLITSSGLRTNLTIRRVHKSDFGLYRVTVTNIIGKYDQYLYLVQKEHTNTEIKGDCDASKQQMFNTGIIVSITLGILVLVVSLYAIIMTVYFKRKLIQQESASTKQGTYVNTSYNTEEDTMVFSKPLEDNTTAGDQNDEISMQQYTDLIHSSNDDKTYDVINKY